MMMRDSGGPYLSYPTYELRPTSEKSEKPRESSKALISSDKAKSAFCTFADEVATTVRIPRDAKYAPRFA